jgi:methylmalonyl-CoA/ethylmalonyl-CoA epimerase
MIFHHLGIATLDLKKSLIFIRENFEVIKHTDIVYDPQQGAELILVTTKDINFELVSGPIVERFIEKQQSYYHVCYEVRSIEKAIESFNHSVLISPPKEAILFDNRKVAFLLTPIGLVEFLESEI